MLIGRWSTTRHTLVSIQTQKSPNPPLNAQTCPNRHTSAPCALPQHATAPFPPLRCQFPALVPISALLCPYSPKLPQKIQSRPSPPLFHHLQSNLLIYGPIYHRSRPTARESPSMVVSHYYWGMGNTYLRYVGLRGGGWRKPILIPPLQ